MANKSGNTDVELLKQKCLMNADAHLRIMLRENIRHAMQKHQTAELRVSGRVKAQDKNGS